MHNATRLPLLALMMTLACLAGCNTDKDEDAPVPQPTEPTTPPARGVLLQTPPVLTGRVSAANLLVKLSLAANAQLLGVSGAPTCSIAVYRLRYQTVGGAGEPSTASAALMVPEGSGAECSGPRPVVLYAHGTNTSRAYNLADLDNDENAEGLLMAAVFAAQGYIVVAPNYVGYDGSSVESHAYLNADQQSKDMIDALAAARSAMPTAEAPQTRDSGRLFITGYSQGGYVAMATHRAMQSLGMTVTASAPMSGPYALAAFVDAVFFGRVNSGAPIYITFLVTAYQKAYGTLYANPAEAFEAPYATGIDTLLPTALLRSELYSQNRLPREVLFSATAPAPEFAAVTPATTPTGFAPLFARGFGAANLIRNEYRLAYLRDGLANPDGGWPSLTTGVVAANPLHPLRRASAQNDLRNWVPSAPVLLCAGSGDPTVFWFNTELMQAYWAAQGAASAPVTVLDIDAVGAAGDPFTSFRSRFTAAKDALAAGAVIGGANDGGALAVSEAYHSTLVPPFCLGAVRSYFAAR